MRPLASLATAALLALTACGTATQEAAPATDAADASDGATEAPAAGTGETPGARAGLAPGAPVPDVLKFEAETIGGETFDGRRLAGQPAVLWFWSPWCPTCRAQGPGVSALQDDFGDRVGIVGVGGLDEAANMGDFASAVDDDVTLLSDPAGDVWRRFGVTAQSTYVVLDASGATVASGYLDDGELRDLVADLAG